MMPASPHRHLDDESLNAVLDDEATPEERAGAADCGECSVRLDRLRLVAQAIGAPTPAPDAGRRQAMIDAARRAGEPDVAPPPALVSRRRWRGAPAWAAAAAVIVAGALALPLVGDLGRDTQVQERATAGDAGNTDESSAGGAVADEQAPLGPGVFQADQDAEVGGRAGVNDLGDIDLNGLDELAASLRQDLQQSQPLDRAGPGAAPTAEAARPDAEDQSVGVRPPQKLQPCEEPARRRDGGLGPVLYAAEATVEGSPAVVLAFEVTSAESPSSLRLLVFAADTCDEIAAEP